MFTILSLMTFCVGCALALWVAKSDQGSAKTEIGRFLLSSVGVFLGAFVALELGQLVREQEEKKAVLRTIKASVTELELFKVEIENLPSLLEEIRDSDPKQSTHTFFLNNPVVFPEITRRSLQDIGVTRRLSFASIANVYRAQRKLDTCLQFLNTADVAHDSLIASIPITKRVTEDLIRFLTFEYRYQNDQIDEDTLVKFHQRYARESVEKVGSDG